MQQSPSWEANQFSARQEIPTFYGSRRFIDSFTSARHLSLSWAISIQSMPPIPLPEDPSSHLRLGSPSGLFPSGFLTKTLHTTLLPHTCYIPLPSHYSRFYHPNNIGWGVQIINSSLFSFIHSPLTSSVLSPDILLSNLFSNTLSLRSFFNMSDQVSHPYKKQVKF